MTSIKELRIPEALLIEEGFLKTTLDEQPGLLVAMHRLYIAGLAHLEADTSSCDGAECLCWVYSFPQRTVTFYSDGVVLIEVTA